MITSNIIKITVTHACYTIDIVLNDLNTFSIFTPITEVEVYFEDKNSKFQVDYILAYWIFKNRYLTIRFIFIIYSYTQCELYIIFFPVQVVIF